MKKTHIHTHIHTSAKNQFHYLLPAKACGVSTGLGKEKQSSPLGKNVSRCTLEVWVREYQLKHHKTSFRPTYKSISDLFMWDYKYMGFLDSFKSPSVCFCLLLMVRLQALWKLKKYDVSGGEREERGLKETEVIWMIRGGPTKGYWWIVIVWMP